MLYTYHLETPVAGFVSITAQVKGAVAESGVQSGICVVYCPHTTAGIPSMKTLTQTCSGFAACLCRGIP